MIMTIEMIRKLRILYAHAILVIIVGEVYEELKKGPTPDPEDIDEYVARRPFLGFERSSMGLSGKNTAGRS
jgi:hypothetical protein